MEPTNIIDTVIANDKESFMAAFNAAISNKVSDALEIKKVELASTLLFPEVNTTEAETSNETNGIETQVDGATDSSIESA